MLLLTDFRFATVSELFRYKKNGFKLPPFHGYTPDQWGIKAHNRPWIEEAGSFVANQKIIEVGGAYSTLPAYLASKYKLEAWVGDDFGEGAGELKTWARWGDPRELSSVWPDTKYVFKPFGKFSKEYPDDYFDRVFSVSTLEHIPYKKIPSVFEDMHRVLSAKGFELHTIDIAPRGYKNLIAASVLEKISLKLGIDMFRGKARWLSPTWHWLKTIEKSGVDISGVTSENYPYSDRLLNKDTLFESYDAVYRFYPPNDAPKRYNPSGSLLVKIQDV